MLFIHSFFVQECLCVKAERMPAAQPLYASGAGSSGAAAEQRGRGGAASVVERVRLEGRRTFEANSRPRSESRAMSISSDSFPMSLSRTHPPATRRVTGSAGGGRAGGRGPDQAAALSEMREPVGESSGF